MSPREFANQSIPWSSDASHQEDPAHVRAAFLGVLMFLCAFCSGGTVLLAYRWGRRNAARVYVTSLCVSDVIIVCICMPPLLAQTYTNGVWKAGKTMCKYGIAHLATLPLAVPDALVSRHIEVIHVSCHWCYVSRQHFLIICFKYTF